MPAVAPSPTTGNPYTDALLGGVRWATTSLTYSFPMSASAYGNSYGSGEMAVQFGSFSAKQQDVARLALKLYASVANLSFQELIGTSVQSADLRFAKSDAAGTAWAYFPDTNASGGDVWVNNSSRTYESPFKGNYAYLTIIHEIGHALGLEHPHEGGMPLDRDSIEYTVMSYRSYVGASTTAGYTNETWGYAQSLMVYDIAAIQDLYGANFSTNSGNTVYSWSPATGEMFLNGVGQGAPGGNRILTTIWDGGGIDTYDLSNYTTGLSIDLQPGQWTKTSPGQTAKLQWDGSKTAIGNIANALLFGDDTRSLIERAYGGSGNDTIRGNVADNVIRGNGGDDKLYGLQGNDNLSGGSGNDRLYGGNGADTLSGGGGADVFVFTSTNDSRVSAFDVITGFSHNADRIDLRSIDANTKKGGNQAFSFIGGSGFHHKAGELRFASGYVSGDVNGDGVADFKIKMAGLSKMVKGDFYL